MGRGTVSQHAMGRGCLPRAMSARGVSTQEGVHPLDPEADNPPPKPRTDIPLDPEPDPQADPPHRG